jgi:hypothetical protein
LLQGWLARDNEALRTAKEDRSYCFVSRANHQSIGETMSTTEAVAVITGASQGIGAALVQAFRLRNYRVVETSRFIKPSMDPGIVTMQGDVANWSRRAGCSSKPRPLWPRRYADQ